MAILGGSPLGLIGVRSTPTRTGMSTFNAGNSRNVNVFYYNSGKESDPNKQGEKAGKTINEDGGMYSMFSTKGTFKPWANISKIGTEANTSGLPNADGKSPKYNLKRNRLHSNDIYDTSLLNIIEKLSDTPAALRPSDFAYCKDIGVYPNNRLMIARRFAGPVGDNIYGKSVAEKEATFRDANGNTVKYFSGEIKRPLAVLVSWKGEEDFLDFDFGEKWVDAKADFGAILTAVGEDFLGGKLGKKVGGMAGALPLPGFTEHLQRYVLEQMGIFRKGSSGEDLPSGNPNLIKEAKKRTTVDNGEAGSGLSANISIKMTCEYEQKFISGIDPTIVWQDLLATILRFGSSNSTDFGLADGAAQKLKDWVNNPGLMLKEIATAIKNSVSSAIGEITSLITQQYDDKIANASTVPSDEKEEEEPDTRSDRQKLEDEKKEEIGLIEKFASGILNVGLAAIEKTIGKYKEEVKGIVNALSGQPSTPWHITIGNPLRPIFCSGDMYTTSVKVKFGQDLAFNDLPSRITVDFTLKNARSLGIQEIMKKFNTGNIRAVNPGTDWAGNLPNQTPGDLSYSTQKVNEAEIEGNGNSQSSNNAAGDDNKNTTKSSENSENKTINPDPNSESPAEEKEG
jgi:hypothetical protein